MGVFLFLDIIPERISKEEWTSLYQETLTLLEQFRFLGLVEDDGYYYAARSAHQENLWGGEAGWRVDGDMHSGANMEEFFLYADIMHYQGRTHGCRSNGSDILLSRLKDIDGLPSTRVWGSKTQGKPAHLYLLAIGCLICHRLPNAALVSGDITATQCQQAVEWANQYLAEPIDVPVTADANRLLPRLQAAGLEGDLLLDSFYNITLEPRREAVGRALHDHLPLHVIESYYKKRFLPNRERQSDEIYLNFRETKEYLAQGFDLEALCRAVMVAPDGNRLEPREFLKALLEMKLHIPLDEKILYDFTLSPRARGLAEVDSVNRMLFQFWCIMRGAGNMNVAAYYPLEEICSAFEAVLGTGEYMAMAKELLEEIQGSDKNEVQDLFYDGVNSCYKRLIEKQEEEEAKEAKKEYDIQYPDDIIEYHPGDTVQPDLHAGLITFIKQVREIGEPVFADAVKDKDAEARKSFFCDNYRTLIPKTIKDAIYARIMDDDYIVRYVSLYSIQVTKDNEWEIRGMLWNPDLLDCYWELAKQEKME